MDSKFVSRLNSIPINFYEVISTDGLMTLFIYFDEKEYNQKDFEKSKNTNSLYNELKTKIIKIRHSHLKETPTNGIMIVVCTQNSKSCTKDHFQHMIKTMLLENSFFLIDKADATSTSNSSSFSCSRKIFGNKPFNCRTRIYGNFNLHSLDYEENKGIVQKDITYKKTITSKEIQNYLWVSYCQKRIINLDANGNGGILFDILIKNKYNVGVQRFIICNSNIKLDSSNTILEKLTDSDMNIKEFPHNFQIIMIGPGGLISKQIIEKNTNIVSEIKKLAKNENTTRNSQRNTLVANYSKF